MQDRGKVEREGRGCGELDVEEVERVGPTRLPRLHGEKRTRDRRGLAGRCEEGAWIRSLRYEMHDVLLVLFGGGKGLAGVVESCEEE